MKLKDLRDRAYVELMALAVRLATPSVREIHNEIMRRGLKSYNRSLESRIEREGRRP